MERPDVYICQKCKAEFQFANFKQSKDEDGLYRLKPTCPECGSDNVAPKWWIEKEES